MPGIAAEFGLRVAVGIWIDKQRSDRNEREIQSAIDLAKRHSNVTAIIVGNETILRGDQTFDELIEMIQRVKRRPTVPVTTGEIWDVWMRAPRAGCRAVDYHRRAHAALLAGLAGKQGGRPGHPDYDKLRRAYPGKRIVIAEFGWPSAGYNFKSADPGRVEQATVLRDFIARAEAYGIDYNIVEAIDQPWKTIEGSVGPYWGVFDASRHAKFDWTGPVSDPDHWKLAGIAILVSVLLSLPILAMSGVTLLASRHAGGRRQRGRRLVGDRVRLSGTAIISCPAPLSRSRSASRCWFR